MLKNKLDAKKIFDDKKINQMLNNYIRWNIIIFDAKLYFVRLIL